jgi:thiopeptide-type bacteriocin biosynthesis protein
MFLLEKMEQARLLGADEIVMQRADLDRWTEPVPSSNRNRAGTTLVRATILRGSLDGGEEKHHFMLLSAGSTSALNLLGRFCHADPKLHLHTAQLARVEQANDSNVIQAEVVHLPQGRVGNVVQRPQLREFEIPVLTSAGVGRDFQLDLSDLLVSVQDGIVRLHSRRLAKEVTPRLASAHSFHNIKNLDVYRFLCHLQSQHSPMAAAWDWGILSNLPKLPRVRFGNVIISRARWNLYKHEIERIRESHIGPESELQRLRRELNLPSYLVLAESDQELWVDFDSESSVVAFVDALKQKSTAVLLEVAAPGKYAVTQDGHHFANELVIPLVLSAPSPNGPPSAIIKTADTSTSMDILRTVHPGGECLFAKFYLGQATSDIWLRRVLPQLIADLEEDQIIDRWFYLRYTDHAPHIRLRLFGPPNRLWSDGLAAVHQSATKGNILPWRITIDSYQRELERYGGGSAMNHIERIFHQDSRAALKLLCLDDQISSSKTRIYTLASVDSFLRSFGFAYRNSDAWGRLTSAPSPKERAVWSRSYRENRPEIEAALSRAGDEPVQGMRSILNARESAISDAVQALRRLDSDGTLTSSLDDIWGSVVHLGINRLTQSTSPNGERRIYDTIRRYHLSVLARHAQMQKPT